MLAGDVVEMNSPRAPDAVRRLTLEARVRYDPPVDRWRGRKEKLWLLLCLELLLGAALARPARGETETENAAPAAAAGERPAESPGGRLRRLDHSGLWPFFSREQFEDGTARYSSLLGAVRAESETDGDYHHHVLPFYCTSLSGGGSDHQLALYPLLYLRRRSPEEDHDAVLPLFWRWRAGAARHVVLWPLIHAAAEPQPDVFRNLPVLYRQGSWSDESRQRLGLPLFLDLFQHARSPDESRWATGVFFPLLGEDTRFGLPLGQLLFRGEEDWHAHLFPLFGAGSWRRDEEGSAERSRYFHTPLVGVWRREEGERTIARGVVVPPLLTLWWRDEKSYFLGALFPLVIASAAPDRRAFGVLPFYLRSIRSEASGEGKPAAAEEPPPAEPPPGEPGAAADLLRENHYLPVLLSHWGSAPGERTVNVLWPLGHWSRRGEDSAVRAIPFFDRSRQGRIERLGIGTILYRRHEDGDREYVSHWAPLPLVFWSRSPASATAWAFPLFFSGRSSGEDSRESTLLVLPSFGSRVEERRWEDGDWRETARHLMLWPVFGRSSTLAREWTMKPPPPGSTDALPGETGGAPGARVVATPTIIHREAWSTLYPFFQVERAAREEVPPAEGPPTPVATEVDAPWPVVHYRGEPEAFDFRFFPVLFTGRAPERKYSYLYPLLAVEVGEAADSNFAKETSLFQWFDGPGSRHFRMFPFLFNAERRGDERRVTGPVGLFHYRASPDGGWFHLLPLGYGAWKGDRVHYGIFPLYHRRQHGADPIDYWAPARFFFLWNTLLSEKERHDSILWKLSEYTRNAAGDYDFRVAHRLIVNRNVQGQREVVFNPLFGYVRDDVKGTRTFSILKFLYRAELEAGEETHRVLMIPVSRKKA